MRTLKERLNILGSALWHHQNTAIKPYTDGRLVIRLKSHIHFITNQLYMFLFKMPPDSTQQQQQLQPPPQPPPKPIKLRNLINDEQTVDNLHFKYKHNNKSHGCSETRCLASLINPKPVEYKVRSVTETFEHAKDFINNFYASIKRLDSPAHKTRLLEIEEQLKTNETYYLKETELIYGAKLAWRNAARCIGRIQWSKLQVFDARFTTNANEMFEALCNHIKYATNKGSLRSAITILPQRVKSLNNDWRIWNSQLIGYAGYKNKETNQVIGDPANVEITEICQKLGWKGVGTRFDILPLVLSANGGQPQMFTLPEDLILRVKIKHPKFKWFEELKLEWYALPAVANMMLDVGGLQFTAAPFSGWYMVTEIGTRDLGDSNRYNVLEEVAQRMGLNTRSNMSLWKDQAVVELNIAVLDSFQSAGVTIVDHHTATDTFMTHLSNEQRLRGGCPADWVWLVPPTSGSSTQVFHQEMVSYHLLPNYEYQEPVWKNFDWNAWQKLEEKKREQEANNRKRIDSLATCDDSSKSNCFSLSPTSKAVLSSNGELTPRKLRFKEIARAVKFTSKLFGKALSRRIKATILYATETGKSERFANKLAQTFSCAFNVHLMSMSDYDMTCLEHEALLLVVTSTFGNGDPPENGELFAKHLAAVKLTGDTSPDIDSINSVSTNPFFQMLSEDHKDSERNFSSSGLSNASFDTFGDGSSNSNFPDSAKGILLQVNKQEEQTNIRPLSNVRFGVFALGSTAYPHFCAFGRYVDQTLGELGAERILKCTCGDELCGQEKAFNEWSNQVFKTACDVFCLTDSIGPIEDRPEMKWSPQDVRFVPVELIPEPSDLSNDQSSLQQQPSSISSENGTGAQKQISTQLQSSELLSNKMVIVRNLMNITNKLIIPFTVKNRIDLHPYNEDDFSDLQTLCIDLESDFISSSHINGVGGTVQNMPSSINNNQQTINNITNKQNNPITFEAGDHVAIYPVNNKEMVEKILSRMREGEEMSSSSSSTTAATGEVSDTDTDIKHNTENKIKTTTTNRFNFDQVYTILVKRENMDLTPATPMAPQNALGGSGPNGSDEDCWINHDRLPVLSIREALMRYLDITSPPNQEFLLILSRQTNDPDERKKLQQMARNFTIYEEWKNKKVPTLLSVLEEFKTIKFEPALVTQIPLIKPRFYSVSGTSTSLTLGVVRFKTISGECREGLCSNYLNRVPVNYSTYVYGYIRSAPAFHMPVDKSIPMILISAGTGIAPFRSFWQQRYADMYKQPLHQTNQRKQQQSQTKQIFGRVEMYFGCRNSNYILYKDELDEMYENGVLSSINIAFSRPRDCDVLGEDTNLTTMTKFMTNPSTGTTDSAHHYQQPIQKTSKVASSKQARKKMYVQDKLLEHGDDIYRLIMQDGAHVYVCGDVAMADGVYKTLANIFKSCFKANKLQVSGKNDPSSGSANANDSIGMIGGELARSSDDGEGILMSLRNLNRYHEDIFGAKQMS